MEPSTEAMKDAFLTSWHRATADTSSMGAVWYRESRRHARRLAREHGVPVSRAAGVIAALSPRVQWAVNLRMADAALAGRPYGGLKTSKRKAAAIVNGERPLDVLRGPKTRAFYRAIMGAENAAVVDTWMLKAAGWPGASVTSKQYERVASAMGAAAQSVGVPTATFQATVWTEVRGKAA